MEVDNIKSSKNLGVQFWVGVFFIFGMLCFSYLAVNIAGMKFSNVGFYTVYAEFKDISGLKDGAPVEIAGVKIGEVKNISLNKTQALVTLQIKDEFEIRDDDIAQIRTKGIIGDKYIRLSPGGSDMIIKRDGYIADTESSVDFEEIIGKFIYSLNKDEKEETK